MFVDSAVYKKFCGIRQCKTSTNVEYFLVLNSYFKGNTLASCSKIDTQNNLL
jgi:hypothetical protein